MNAAPALAGLRRWAALAGVVCGLAGAGATRAADAPVAPAALATGQISVSEGRELLRDCRPWVPHGLSFFGRLVPRGWVTDRGTEAARDQFGAGQMELAKVMGSDVVRYQVGMPFLDPQSAQFNPPYLDEIKQAVAMARGEGLSVILSMQWQSRVNVKPVEMQPKASALRAWQRLAPVYAGDKGVMYELFNEPASPYPPRPGDWEAWRRGHQAIIDDLRLRGIRNVLIVDGLNGAKVLAGSPPLRDPVKQLAYAVHPYFRDNLNSPAEWDANFGDFAREHAVIVTEWSHRAEACAAGDGGVVDQFLGYLGERRIGLIGYGADELNSRLGRTRDGKFALSSFRQRACTAVGAGPGEAMKGYFERLAAQAAKTTALAASACNRP